MLLTSKDVWAAMAGPKVMERLNRHEFNERMVEYWRVKSLPNQEFDTWDTWERDLIRQRFHAIFSLTMDAAKKAKAVAEDGQEDFLKKEVPDCYHIATFFLKGRMEEGVAEIYNAIEPDGTHVFKLFK